MPLNATNFVTKGPVLHADMLQFFNLFTGVMLDQPVTFKNTLTLGGNQGSATVPLKVYGAVGQTGHLLDLYADTGQAQPGFGFGASGNFAWGPGGASPQDTFLSRVATQNGHASDTAGLLVQPYLEVAGNVSATSYLFTNQATLTGPGTNPFQLNINQDLLVQRGATIGGTGIAAYAAGGAILNLNASTTTPPATAISIGGPFIGSPTGAYSAVAGLNSQAVARPGANNTAIYSNYLTLIPQNPGGFTGLSAVGTQMAIQPVPSGFVDATVLILGLPSGASSTNRSLLANGLAEINSIKVTGNNVGSSPNAGFEMLYSSNRGYIQGYNRSSATWEAFQINAATTVVQGNAGGNAFQVSGGPATFSGHLQVTGQSAPIGGAGFEAWGGGDGIAQAFNRNTGAWTNLYLRGANVYADPQGGTFIMPANCVTQANIQAGAVSQRAVIQSAPSGSVTSTSYIATPDPFGVTGILLTIAAGATVFIWGSTHVSPSAVGGQLSLGLYQNGSLLVNLGGYYLPAVMDFVANWHILTSPAAGQYRWTLAWASTTGAQINFQTAVYSFMSALVIYK